jgi:hypothetical protein
MKRLLIGICVISIVSVFFLWSVISLAWVALKLAISLVVFLFCIYILYVFWGALMELFRRK